MRLACGVSTTGDLCSPRTVSERERGQMQTHKSSERHSDPYLPGRGLERGERTNGRTPTELNRPPQRHGAAAGVAADLMGASVL